MDEKQAIELLKKYSHDEKSFKIVLAHSKAVQKIALKMAKKIPGVDIDFISIGSVLHDIGRFDCPPGKNVIRHGLRGAEILRKEGFDKLALMAERHLGAGISKKEIVEQKLDLPARDFIPLTKEEKIISDADNLTDDGKEISIEKCVERYRKELGEKVAEKILKQHQEVLGMMR